MGRVALDHDIAGPHELRGAVLQDALGLAVRDEAVSSTISTVKSERQIVFVRKRTSNEGCSRVSEFGDILCAWR